ncbi:hypothetical protein TNCV_1780171 [Trichonephila clavipes]|nr:hypothetical protein TNCV_1780171 [Trichonephila clavipes]
MAGLAKEQKVQDYLSLNQDFISDSGVTYACIVRVGRILRDPKGYVLGPSFRKDNETQLTLNEVLLDCPTGLSEEFTVVEDDNVRTAPTMANKDILELV